MTTGKSRADFPGAFIPFDKTAGSVPAVPIDSAPTVQFCVNEEWLPLIVTCLKALARPETWDDTYDNAVIAASEFAALIAGISDGCGTIVPSVMCISGDFSDLDYGFVSSPGAPCVAIWTHGTGWQMCADATPQGFLFITRDFGGDTIIREVHVHMFVTVPYLINYDVVLFHGSTFTSIASASAVTGPDIQVDVIGLSEVASALFIYVTETFGGAAADVVIDKWGLCYTGAFPLSTAPDTWVKTFDFTASNGSPYNGSLPFGSYTSGVGYVATSNPPSYSLRAWIDFPQCTLTRVDMICSCANQNGSDADDIRVYEGTETGTVLMRSPATHGDGFSGTDFILSASGLATVQSIFMAFDSHAAGGGFAKITGLVLHGVGFNPFA